MLAGRDHDPKARARCDVDVRIDAALTYQFEPGEALDQGRLNFRALADQHETFGVLQARGKRIGVLHMVVPDRRLMAVELAETGKRAHRVEIVVQDRDFHAPGSLIDARSTTMH